MHSLASLEVQSSHSTVTAIAMATFDVDLDDGVLGGEVSDQYVPPIDVSAGGDQDGA